MEKLVLENCENIRKINSNKKRSLIRSSALNKLSEKDKSKLIKEYKLKVIIDLRTTDEVNIKPDCNIQNVKYYHIPLVNEETLGVTFGNSKEEKLINLIDSTPNMCDLYKNLVTRDKARAWSKIFDILLNTTDGSIIWHCQQGKDRCGIVSAMIEYCLGFDYTIIIDDYLESNKYCHTKAENMYEKILEITNQDNIAKNIKKLFLAEEKYIKTSFDYIEKEYGSVNNFLYQICDLNEEKIEKLRKIYLEKE